MYITSTPNSLPAAACFLTACFCLCGTFLKAQNVSNVRTHQDGKQVVIEYDLAGKPTDRFDITLFYSQTGTDWKEPQAGLSGTIGKDVTPGSGLTIRWSPLLELNRLAGSGYRFKVRATLKDTDPYSIVQNMVTVQGGTFTMGCTGEQGTDCDLDEKPAHRVTISSFKICKYEVTVAQFNDFVQSTGYVTDAEKGDGSYVWSNAWKKWPGINWRYDTYGTLRLQVEYNHPVINVSWNDANAFCNWMSEITGQRYRLPTEAEWEFAARGGTQSRGYRYSGNTFLEDAGWYNHISHNKTHIVGKKEPNELGLFDMSGNVAEWCSDSYDAAFYKNSPSKNPKNTKITKLWVVRGGSWLNFPSECRVASRIFVTLDMCNNCIGFRLAQDL